MRVLVSFCLTQDPPGYNGFYMDARFIDKTRGYKQTEFGKVLKWDKFMTQRWEHPYPIEEAFIDFGNKITEVLCDEL